MSDTPLHCPTCKQPVLEGEPGDGAWPFCSPRCKLIDLGRWLNGVYQVPVSAPQDHLDVPDSPAAGCDRIDKAAD